MTAINLPHHVSRNLPQMPLRDRAAQFAPFAALTGYEAAVGETARLTVKRREFDAQEAEELDRRLTERAARLKDRPEVTIEYVCQVAHWSNFQNTCNRHHRCAHAGRVQVQKTFLPLHNSAVHTERL
ncbi:MAG: hypothetical protein IJH79_12085, partial [Lentisphaeria bacterium]|nr:hypothetical protein [Lentisphaeria bacterium]